MTPLQRLQDAVGFIDQTIYANEDNPKPSTWRNDEVLDLLSMVRERLTQSTEQRDCTCGVAWGTSEGPCVCEDPEPRDEESER